MEVLEDRAMLAAGDLDLTFGDAGKVTTDFPGPDADVARDVVAVQSDNKIVVVGRSQQPDTSYDILVARYLGGDGDGVGNRVDPQASTYSADFSDGITSGTITDHGAQQLDIVDAPNPADGVVITASPDGGATPASISACAGASTFSLTAGDQVIVTCGSITLDVIAGQIEVTFHGDDGTLATTTLDGGTAEDTTVQSVTFYPDTFTFSTPETNDSQVVVLVDGDELTVAPGETLHLVGIDIKPGTDPNSINLGSNGTVAVAILSTLSFDATTVDPTTVTLANSTVKLRGNGTPMSSEEDVNADGLLDLVVHVETEALELTDGDVQAELQGTTYGGEQIHATGTVRIVAELRASAIATGGSADVLSEDLLAPIVQQAIADWSMAGYDVTGVHQIDFRATDLPGATVGLATGSQLIWIDQDAAGHGWSAGQHQTFIDANLPGARHERFDLQAVVSHELGHILGLMDFDPQDHPDHLMASVLSAGPRPIVPGMQAALPQEPHPNQGLFEWLHPLAVDQFFGGRSAERLLDGDIGRSSAAMADDSAADLPQAGALFGGASEQREMQLAACLDSFQSNFRDDDDNRLEAALLVERLLLEALQDDPLWNEE